MDFTTFVTQNIKAISYITLLAVSKVYVISFWRKRRELIEKRQKIVNKKIICQQQALKRLQSSCTSKDDKTYLIKGFTQLQNDQIEIKKDISSNQLWLIEPSLNKIAIQVVNKFNQYEQASDKQWYLKNMTDFDIQKHLKWQIGSNSKMEGLTIPVKGYGEILDHEIFKVTCNYLKDPKKGVFTTLAENIAYFFQFIFFSNLRRQGQQKIKSMSQNNNRAPFIMGPVIGIVKYFLGFIHDRPLLIEAKFQGGRLLPLSLSSSKENIISSLNTKIYNVNFRILESLVVTYFAYRLLSPHLKKLSRDFKSWIKNIMGTNVLLPKKHEKFTMLENSKIGENLVCIICYTNCRNTIIFNCKHMIMCDECLQTFKEKPCPLCKGQISEQKVLTKE